MRQTPHGGRSDSSLDSSSCRSSAEAHSQPIDLTPRALTRWVEAQGLPSYRVRQVLRWVYQRRATSLGGMTDVPQAMRDALADAFAIPSLQPVTVQRSRDGTRKLLFRLPGGEPFESVLIPDAPRMTLCISSQAGCGMGCRFCATAQLGLKRNLRASDIARQVVAAHDALDDGERVTNIVFMGMGEPLANYDAVVDAIEILTAEWGQNFSNRRITVSTVGLVPQMQRLIEETNVNLAVSLTATTDALRDDLMPINRRYPLETLMAACRALPIGQRRRITFEYVLLAGVNDDDSDADRLARLLRGIRSKVNLIPFNAFPGSDFRPPLPHKVRSFQERLLAANVSATVRHSRGPDIFAACGQLAGTTAA
jgi:23S rRNA (adenine2503-C2)-methyltransferase